MSKASCLAVVLVVFVPCACSHQAEAPRTSVAETEARPLEEELEDSIVEGPDLDADVEVFEPELEAELLDAELEAEEEDPSFLSDSPSDSDAFKDVVGFGGGAGGKFGGRFGGRKTLRSVGGSAAEASSESYAPVRESGFRRVADDPLSTFAIDVDTAAYANVRRFLNEGSRPPADAVRIEELLNTFRYDDPLPAAGAPFAVTSEVASCPWEPTHRLLRIGIRALDLGLAELPAANLVFLIDVSGSMQSREKLPLLQKGLRMLVEQLDERDRVAIVVYAGASGLALPSTSCRQRGVILDALARLEAGGSTAGAAGIRLAYQVARENLLAGGNNRVILATDGDFNVGVSDRGALEELIREEARSGVFLSVLGFGRGNLQDDRLETLADRGNGNYSYVDCEREAKKVLVEELGGTLVTVAKDVKIQLEFNPLEVQAWRQIGYENRALAASDFRDDTKDAGEIGAGHTLTALFELVPVGVPFPAAAASELRYQTPAFPSGAAASGELLRIALRWKAPEATESIGSEIVVRDDGRDWGAASTDFRFAASVAAFGLVLRASEHRGQATLALADGLARGSLGEDPSGMRAEYLELLSAARTLGL